MYCLCEGPITGLLLGEGNQVWWRGALLCREGELHELSSKHMPVDFVDIRVIRAVIQGELPGEFEGPLNRQIDAPVEQVWIGNIGEIVLKQPDQISLPDAIKGTDV
jgi:hypothetical protein